jgi:hypothetical protein
MFDRLPRHFQQQALLGVHHERLVGADAEEAGVEVPRVVDEAAFVWTARVRLLDAIDAIEIPSSIDRKGRDGILA